MKQYKTYKDSGVQWLGEIPTHWDVKRLKSVISSHFSGCWGEDAKHDNFDRLCIRIADFDFDSQTISDSATTYRNYTEKQIQSCSLNNNDLLLEKSGGGDKTPVGREKKYKKQNESEDLFANFCECLRVRYNQSPHYIAYLLKVVYLKTMMRQFYKQTTGLQNIDIPDYLGMKIILPPLEEQEEIVRYLDEKTAEIDDLVAQVEREIELLKEYKQAEIARVVTKGLNPNAPMKPSGISWIGEMPIHWSKRKIKYTFKERSEKNHPDEPVLCATQSQGVIPQAMYDNRVVVVNKGFENLKFVKVGDFVISLRSFQGGIEYAYYQGIISAAYTIITPNDNIDVGYARLLMKSHSFIQLLKTCVTGIREGQNINYDLLKNKFIPIPPLAEQKEIVDYIDHKTTEIDRLVVELTYQVEYLKEYKQRLIADVVTGKINVQPE